MKAETIIKIMTEKIKQQYHPEKIILFGSYAWGNPDRHSDIDLLIVKKTKARHIDRSIKIRQILDKENGMFALDTIVYTPDEVKRRLKIGDDFIKKIVTKGVVLYG
ncbi:hypothetical protein B9J78_06235 [bacterium Unc6]|nr:hypothetical protein [bacterium Unc6]MBT9129960.1 hypothetical protein [Candidatus Psychracetigena formicireducens]